MPWEGSIDYSQIVVPRMSFKRIVLHLNGLVCHLK
jgi:hypothetical protein